jgi:hypothetical protein
MRLLRLGAFGLGVLLTLRRCGRPRFLFSRGGGSVDRRARDA